MSWSTYQHPQPSEAETRTRTRDASQPTAPTMRNSIGNQGILRRLTAQSASTGVSIKGAPLPDAGGAQPQPTQPQPAPQPAPQPTAQPAQQPGQPPPAPTQPMPYTAVFSIAQHGPKAKSACGLPDTPNCVVSAANWRLIDKAGAPVAGTVTLSEQFTKESGPDDVFNKLVAQQNSTVTSQNGAFGDCYGLCVPDGTPSFSLQVLQNYLVGGQIASQTHITYSPSRVMLRVCQREADGSFGTRCRRF